MSLKGEFRTVAAAALGRVALRRWVFLILGGALVTPFYFAMNTLAGLLVPSPGPVAGMALQFGSFLAALPLVAAGAAVAARFVRPLEAAAVRALLTASVPPAEGEAGAHRGRTAGWAVLHLGVGTLVAGATLTVPPAATVLLLRPVAGGGWKWMSDVPAWAGPPAGAFLLAGLASWAWAGGRLLEHAAPRLLGPSAAERLAAAERAHLRLAERNRLARELHDTVGHALSIVTLQAAAAGRVLDQNPTFARRALTAIEEAARGAMDELDHVLGLLREEEAERTPRPDLTDLDRLAASARTVGTPVTLHIPTDLATVPAVLSREAYRIAQEGLTNALRHAPGTTVTITVSLATPHNLTVTVENPLSSRRPGGTRFRTTTGGRGAHGIAERTALLGGTATVGPTATTWRLHACLPLTPPRRTVHATPRTGFRPHESHPPRIAPQPTAAPGGDA